MRKPVNQRKSEDRFRHRNICSHSRPALQGDTSGCALGFVDSKTKVVFYFMLLLLKRNFLSWCQHQLGNNLTCHPVALQTCHVTTSLVILVGCMLLFRGRESSFAPQIVFEISYCRITQPSAESSSWLQWYKETSGQSQCRTRLGRISEAGKLGLPPWRDLCGWDSQNSQHSYKFLYKLPLSWSTKTFRPSYMAHLVLRNKFPLPVPPLLPYHLAGLSCGGGIHHVLWARIFYRNGNETQKLASKTEPSLEVPRGVSEIPHETHATSQWSHGSIIRQW